MKIPSGRALVIKLVDGETHRFEESCKTDSSWFWYEVFSKDQELLASFRKKDVAAVWIER